MILLEKAGLGCASFGTQWGIYTTDVQNIASSPNVNIIYIVTELSDKQLAIVDLKDPPK